MHFVLVVIYYICKLLYAVASPTSLSYICASLSGSDICFFFDSFDGNGAYVLCDIRNIE